jgi:hypothetical protein
VHRPRAPPRHRARGARRRAAPALSGAVSGAPGCRGRDGRRATPCGRAGR